MAEGRRSQRAVREQNLLLIVGAVLLVGGALLIGSWLLRAPGDSVEADTDAADAADPGTSVAGITAALQTTTTAPTSAAPVVRSITLATTGDLVPPEGYDDYRPMFASVKPILTAADLALCHLENPEVGSEALEAIASAGYDGCALTDEPSMHEVDGVRVAHLTYPADADTKIIGENARSARVQGAQIVVVSLDASGADDVAPTEEQMLLAAELGALPEIDLVLGHGNAVVQPVVAAGDAVVAFGLGPFLDQVADGVIIEVRFEETGAGTGEFRAADVTYTATRALRETSEIVPIATVINDPEFDEGDREVLADSAAATSDAITLLDDLAHPSGK